MFADAFPAYNTTRFEGGPVQRTHALHNNRQNTESNPADESLVQHAESPAGAGKDQPAPSSKKVKATSASNRTARTPRETENPSHPAPSSQPENAVNSNPNIDRSIAPNAAPDKKPHKKQPAARSSSYAYPELHPAAVTAAVLGTLLEGIDEGVAHVSPDGLILYANKRFGYLIGGEAFVIEPNKTHLRDMVSTNCWVDLDKGLKLAAHERVIGTLKVEEPRQHIPVRTVRLVLTPVRWKSKITIKLTAKELTELLQKNRELQEKEDSLHAISARIMQLQDEERRRIARDLHDVTGQELAVVIMLLMQASREIRADTESLKTITDAAGMVRKIEEEIRTLSYVLHPPLLDELGLGPALSWYIEGFTKRSGIEVKLDLQQDLPRLQKEKELALFRVVQEALTNVMRHSGSRTAQIRVSFNAESVMLAVRDEGKGIGDRRFTPATPKVHGVGIMGMRERIQQFGGSIEVQKLPKGTEVVAVMPIGHAPPIETPFTDDDVLQMARALGYKENVNEPAQPPPSVATPPPASAPPPPAAQASAEQATPARASSDGATAEQASPDNTSPRQVKADRTRSDRAKSAKAKADRAPAPQSTPPRAEADHVTPDQPDAQHAPPVETGPQPPANSTSNSAKKRLLIADDHEVTRHGIRSMLQDQNDIEICGEASNAWEAILKAKKLGPDLIVMDLSMPGGGGFVAANKIRQARMHAKILFFTTHQSREMERLSRIAGFEGLVQKADAARDLVRGIRAILEGNYFYNAQVVSKEEEASKRRAARSGTARA